MAQFKYLPWPFKKITYNSWRGLNLLAGMIRYPNHFLNGVRIHPSCSLGNATYIGRGTKINGSAFIVSSPDAPVYIGKYCAIAHNFRVRNKNHHSGFANIQERFQKQHGFPSLLTSKGSICIGNNVWIADNVTLLPGAKVGDGAILGAGAIVTSCIPPFSIAVGVPAKVIKMRFTPNIIEQLLEIKWWDWSKEKILVNSEFFSIDFSKHPELNLADVIQDV